ncbi:Hypothetical predicted protein [Mytilus galloprovincialis]|uniref:EGF-like domain-containing protein n=2 Tax=Mytilus galloprovincialis TaxID=29158 RepID=A0A8B6DZT8_MYTGA|nr:Hypothetical predicted protein [Mytilus galloprovincialis]
MLPSCNKLLFFLLWMTTYGNTLTISSKVNSTDLDSETSTGLVINSTCKTTHQCSGKLVCFNGQCQCCENHIWNGTNCILEKTFKSLCEHNTECETTLFCIYGTCQCAQMHYWNGNICLSKKKSNGTCTNSKECRGKLVCDGGVCQCPINLFWNGSTCIFKKFHGDFCRSSIACADNMECRDSICQCSESEYRDNSKCTAKKSVNDACVKQGECGITLYCARSVCQCASSDYWAGSKCLIKKDENAFCNSSLECKVTLQCKRNHCICCEQDFWNGQLCEKKVCVIEQCLNGGRCQISNKRDKCVCAEGYLGDRCQYADGKEKHFVVIFHEAYGTASPRILPTANRRGELFVFYFANNRNVSVPLNSINTHSILDSNVLMTNGLHQAGAEIHSNIPITLYGFLFTRGHFSEGFLVLPTRFASTDYIIPSFTVSTAKNICQSIFALSPVYSSTVIQINFKMKDGSVSYDNIRYSNNQTLTLVLNKYTTFQIWHLSDLTGTIIIASKPIVVVSGNRCNYINVKGLCQPFIEMVVPTNQLDNVYVIPYLKYRLANTVRVLAVNNTSVDIKAGNNRSRDSLKSREFIDYLHTTISYVSSESDVLVHIYPHELLGNHGDAFMMTIPGINQYLYDYDFMVPTDFESFISVTVPTDAVDGFVLDGNFVNLKNIFSISEEEHHFSSFSIPISSGPHHITHREKTRFGLWIYGNYTYNEAYGYLAGMAFKT